MPSKFINAGFRFDGAAVFPILNLQYDDNSYSKGLAPLIRNFVARKKDVSAGDIEGWYGELTPCGPRLTSCDVRCSVVMRSKADVTRTSARHLNSNGRPSGLTPFGSSAPIFFAELRVISQSTFLSARQAKSGPEKE
jgi:hypothetical protein